MRQINTLLSAAHQKSLHSIASAAGMVEFDLVEKLRDISMRVEGCPLGPIELFRYEGHGLRSATRSARQVRNSPADDFLVLFPVSKPIRISQRQRDFVIQPGSFSFISTGLPYELESGEPPNYDYTEFFVKVPAALLRQRSPSIDAFCATPIDAEHGACKILSQLIETTFSERQQLSEIQAHIVGGMLLDALSMISPDACRYEAADPGLPQRQGSAVRWRAKRFIDANLSNPRLSLGMVAEHCNVSERKLYAAFAADGTTVGTYIRASRLQRCKAELSDARLSDHSILEIALRWGYSNPASFSRAYRMEFGCSPRTERNRSEASAPAM